MNRASKKPTEVDAEVGDRIRIMRLEQEMSQTVLADAVGVTFQQLQKYEKGMNRVSASRLVAFAKALKIDPGYLLGGNGATVRPADTRIERMLVDLHGHKLAAAFLAIDDREVQASIAAFVEIYARALERKQWSNKRRGAR